MKMAVRFAVTILTILLITSGNMQAAQAGDAPVLIRIETRAGHGSGKPTEMIIEEYADSWAFLVHSLGMILPEGYGS